MNAGARAVDEVLQKLRGVTLTKGQAEEIRTELGYITMPDPPDGTVEFLNGTTRPVAVWWKEKRWNVPTISPLEAAEPSPFVHGPRIPIPDNWELKDLLGPQNGYYLMEHVIQAFKIGRGSR